MASRQRRAAGRRRGPWIAIAGTRPNYVKLAPLIAAARAAGRRLQWIDTGQHTARALSRDMCRDLALPAPVASLRAPKRNRIARMAKALEKELAARRPSLVVVLGDVDSTLAGALAAYRRDLPLVHIEAGLRSFERAMPEERNRVLVDHMSDRLYLSEPQARENLVREGIPYGRARSAGNVMADALRALWSRIETVADRRLEDGAYGGYAVATLHRQANVDDPDRLAAYARALERIAHHVPIVFPVHPRTRKHLAALGLLDRMRRARVRVEPPRPYVEFLGLVRASMAVITDSGGLQVEAALMQLPCVVARRRTEHTLVLERGRTVVAGTDPRRLYGAFARIFELPLPEGRTPRAWDGHAAERIVADWCKGFDRPARLASPDIRLLRAAGVS